MDKTFSSYYELRTLICHVSLFTTSGFKNPSAIQQRGIVSFCKELDVIQQAQAGPGMTVALCSGILQRLVYSFLECQALVLSPTRKGAQKIEKMLGALGCYLGVKVYAATGATSVCEHQQDFSNGFHVIVGTPGCILDMLLLLPSFLRMFGLGHADVMLDQMFAWLLRWLLTGLPTKGPSFFLSVDGNCYFDCQSMLKFIDNNHNLWLQVFDIFKRLPSRIQVKKVFQLLPSKLQVGLSLLQCRKIQYKPVRILLKQDEHIGKHIKQFYVDVEEEMKLESLVNLHDASATTESIIVFVTANTKLSLTDNIRTWLRTNGMRSCMNSNQVVLVFLSPPIINYDLPARARRSVCFGRRKNAV
nr:PREDICTED: eukaryotic initiation factor 4A-1-like [Musa acuminata subsp. malaccensis]